MANVVRPISEKGIVLNKQFKKAMDAFTGSDGRKVDALPDRYVVTVASSFSVSKETGLEKPVILDYKVDKDMFDKLSYLSKVEVVYEMSNTGTNKPISVTPIA